MSAETNVAATRRLISEGFTEGRLEVCDELVAEDAIEHQAGLRPGREGAKETIRTLHRWFSDFELRIEDLAATEDTVWIRCTGSGVNTGRVFGHPPTGRRTSITVFDVLRWSDGKLVEHWGVPDQLSLLVQLGIFDPRAQATEAGAADDRPAGSALPPGRRAHVSKEVEQQPVDDVGPADVGPMAEAV